MDNKKTFNVEEFSKNSEEFYDGIKADLEKTIPGKFVALDYESKKYWIGETVSEALKLAKESFPNKLFYLVQIGYPSTFTIQSNIRIRSHIKSRYDINRAYR